MVRKLVNSAAGTPAPVHRIWTRLDPSVRQQAENWVRNASAYSFVPEGLRQAIVDGLDETIFDDRSLYDPAVWPDPGFDPGEAETVKKLAARNAPVSRDELGYVNRRLLEKALPDHVLQIARSNRLLAMNGAQMGYGGGAGDGFIYFLRSVPWQSAGPTQYRPTIPATAPPTNAAAATLASKTPPSASPPPPKPPELLDLNVGDFEDHLAPAFVPGGPVKVPGYTTYAVCRSPERRRPLFQHGRANGGDFKLFFSRDALESNLFKVKTTGGFVLDFEPDAILAADTDDFAAADWLRRPSEPHLRITVLGMKKWTEMGESSRILFDPSRGGRSRNDEPLSASFKVFADLNVAAGGKTAQLRDVPVKATVRDWVKHWSIRFDTQVELPPASVDEKATLPVSMKLTHETFCPVPKSQTAK
jgi:hypothetical protein